MAFSTQDIELLRQQKAEGKTKEQALAALSQSRRTPSQPTETRFGDVGEDIKTGVSRIGEDLTETGGQIIEGAKATFRGEQTPQEGIIQTAGLGLKAGLADIGGNILQTAGKLFTKQSEEEKIAEKVGGAVEATGIPEFVEGLDLSERAKRNLGAAEGFFEAFTLGAGKTLTQPVRQSLKQSDDALLESRKANPAVSKGNFITKAIKDARFNLSDIDPQVETVLQRSNFDEVNRYHQQAKSHKKDSRKDTPLEIAGSKAEKSFDAISEARINAINGKKAILEQVADQKVPGNTLNEVMSTGIQRMNEKFGAKIDANGTISQAKGRSLTLDATDQKLVTEYVSRMNSLGVSPSVKQVDDFVDWAQGQLYKQSKTLSKLEVASDPVIRELQKVTGDLNGRLKTEVAGGYGEVNARISNLIELQDELSRALGADARKGGGLMKTLFSPTGGNTRKIFAEIQAETGIDLFKEATLAKFAMESVGDTKQASLLQQLGAVTETAAEFDFTKPASIIKFLQERADLDGQELANEIIRRTNAEKP
jgi:hypothetical protein